ncbi:rRNA-processing protein EBP2 [Malassezia sp. CBS 17886]|nr:rRNA-processing protein EBP2 [Malassezia sp. CBS 17886]
MAPKTVAVKRAPNARGEGRAQRASEAKPRAVSVREEDAADVPDDDEELHDDEDESGISQQGINRLMRALGDDALDSVDAAALDVIRGGVAEREGEDEDEGEEDDGSEEDLGDEDEDEEEEDEEEDEEEEDEEEDGGEDDGEEDEDDDNDGDKDPHTTKDAAKKNHHPTARLPSLPKDSLAASILRSGLVEEDDGEEEEDGGEDDGADDGREEAEEDDDDDDAADELIPVEDLPEGVELSEESRALKHNRIRINRKDVLQRVLDEISLDAGSRKQALPWIETMAIVYNKTTADEIADAQNDLDRELAFSYRQSLHAAVRGRERVLAANVPFSRPDDYFAEMLKTDEHMERVRQRLLDESANIKASEDAKKQRELKKFGKRIQTEKLQERQKNKRDLQDKVNELKRKRNDVDMGGDEFDVQLEDAMDARKEARQRPKMSRGRRDDRYGFGGKKRWAKSNSAESTNDVAGARHQKPGRPGKSGKLGKPGKPQRKPQRPGKGRRAAGRR